MEFYDQLAERYDEMTRFSERLDQEKEMLAGWLARYPFQSAVDAGCGTGLHAILLAELGGETVGVDSSAAMLEKAKSNGAERGSGVVWVHAPLQEMSRQFTVGGYDAVLCVGNTAPHILKEYELVTVLNNFNGILKPGGRIILQLLNYHRILRKKERIVGVRRKTAAEFIRFYDFLGDTVQFNILTITSHGRDVSHNLQSTILRPWMKEELYPVLKECGFGNLLAFGDMKFSGFIPAESTDLVITGVKVKSEE